MFYLAENLNRFARELANDPAHIPARLAGVAGSKFVRAAEGLAGSTRLGKLLGARYRGPGIVLMFHEIHDDVDAALRTGCHPDQLRRVIEAVKADGRDIVTVDEALRRLADGDSRPFALLTFDDGYRDNESRALPILEHYDAPMTMFVPTGMVTRELHAWWLGLRDLFQRFDRVEIEAMDHVFDCSDGASRNAAMRQSTSWIGTDRARAKSLRGTFDRYGISLPDLIDSVALDEAELRALADHPLVTIGGHTTTHTFLSGLGDAEAYADIADNKHFLEALLDRPVDHFAYPYGTAGACGAREAGHVRTAGFRTGFTTRPGQLFAGHLNAPTLLPREDTGFSPMSGAQLANRLNGMRRAMATRFGNPVAGLS